jgi:CRP/FNR family transcriptional regulator, nitrogen oxide reductase regulator
MSDISHQINSLKDIPIYGMLSPECLTRLSRITGIRKLETDHTLFWEGDAPDYFYIIHRGRIKVLKHSSQGKEIIIAFFGAGDMIGEVAVFDDKPYPATAQATEPTGIFRIGRQDFLNLIIEFPEITLGIIRTLSGRLRDSQSRLRDLATERVEQRVASILLMLSGKLGDSLPFTRQEIADMTGTTTETTIRVMSQFKERGIISSMRGRIIIRDHIRLELLSQGPPRV